MKYIKQFYLTMMSLASLLALGSCMDNDINRNPFETTDEEMGRDNYNVGSRLKTLEGQVIPTQEHLYQFMEAMCGGAYGGYFSETNPDWNEKFSTLNPKSDWLEGSFSTIFTNTYPNYRKLMTLKDAPVPQAIAKVLRVAIMQRTTDMFGPIPYSKVVVEGEAAALSSPYDSQDVIYKQMFKELDEADQAFEDNLTLDPEALRKLDDVYYGSVEQWRKYLHSLQLRMAMRICYVPEMKAEAQRIAEAAVAAGVITDNTDNALFHVAENRSALCFITWNDYRIGADILCYMNGYQDPRREKYFTMGKGNGKADGTAGSKEGYYGLRIGTLPTNVSTDPQVSAYSNRVMTTTDPYTWMTAAEVAFLRAEGALRGWAMGGEAKDLYEQGIALSFDQHKVSGAEAYATDNSMTPAAYADPLGKYDTSAPSNIKIAWNTDTQEDHFEENLERVITQKWIAIYPLGIEAWSEHRRTGYPKMLPIVDNKSSYSELTNIGIRRLQYPASEYSLNGGHVEEAVQMLGGDQINIRLWWDCKPSN